jgi:anti-anti-sigma factor
MSGLHSLDNSQNNGHRKHKLELTNRVVVDESSIPGDESLQTYRIALEGEYDVSRSKELDEIFGAAIAADRVIIDFSKTTYIDSMMLKALLRLREQMSKRQPGEVVLLNVSPQVRRIFSISGLTKLFIFR